MNPATAVFTHVSHVNGRVQLSVQGERFSNCVEPRATLTMENATKELSASVGFLPWEYRQAHLLRRTSTPVFAVFMSSAQAKEATYAQRVDLQLLTASSQVPFVSEC
jgi:hypothetical protein